MRADLVVCAPEHIHATQLRRSAMSDLPPVHVVLPCRAGSQRILNKNTREFAGNPDGLLGVKLDQLAKCKNVASVVVTTDDPLVMEITQKYQSAFSIPVHVIPRPAALAASGNLDDFVAYVPTIVDPGVVCWTHVTSPFFGSQDLDDAIAAYWREVTNGAFDSLMGVTRIQTFLWNHEGQCISHDRAAVKWPQTQDLDPIYEVNSSVFMIEREAMIAKTDRIGDKPYLLETNSLASFDIDWPENFEMAEKLMELQR